MSHFEGFARTWLGWVIPASLQLVIVAAIVFVFLRLLGGRMPLLRLALCGVVLLKLGLPLLEAPTAVFGRALPEGVVGGAGFEQLLTGRVELGAVPSQQSGVASEIVSVGHPWTWRGTLLLVYAIGVCALLSGLFLESRRLRGLARAGRILGPGVYISEHVDGPQCFGVFRPTVLLPADLDPRRRPAVLAHELAHLAHRDPLLRALHCGLLALWWFHPVAWWIGRELSRAQEDRCDDAVLRVGGIEPEVYGETLLVVARGPRPHPLTLSMARGELTLARRLRRILNPDLNRRTHMSHLALPIVLAFTLVPFAPATQEAPSVSVPEGPQQVDAALTWLGKQQPSSGAFADGGRAGDALALMAFLGAGQTSERGPQRSVVARAVRGLAAGFTAQVAAAPTRGDALAALALSEHLLLSGKNPEGRATVEAAVKRLSSWAGAEQLDAQVAFWSALALVSAREAGLTVEKDKLNSLRARLPLGATDGAAGWTPAATCAASIFLHLVTGGDVEDPGMAAAVERVLGTAARPVVDDPMLAYLGAVAFYQLGGEAWKLWNLGPLKRLGSGAGADGSFPAPDRLAGGPVASTALAALALQVRYRYARVSER
jgi:BlaR1 peptidase M56